MHTKPNVKLSRVYLEEEWLPFLGEHAPVLDVGKADYTAHYMALARTEQYVTVDIDAGKGPDIVADVTTPAFVERALARYPKYGSVLFNGVIGYGVDSVEQVEASVRHFHMLLRPRGHLLIGWNEWDIDRHDVRRILGRNGFENVGIHGLEVAEPIETEGYGHVKHRYTHWQKR
jgi:hypothetical protein